MLKIEVKHFRVPKYALVRKDGRLKRLKGRPRVFIPDWERRQKKIAVHNRGGKTIVSVIDMEGNVDGSPLCIAHGVAVCSLSDNFDYKVGVSRALTMAEQVVREIKYIDYLEWAEALRDFPDFRLHEFTSPLAPAIKTSARPEPRHGQKEIFKTGVEVSSTHETTTPVFAGQNPVVMPVPPDELKDRHPTHVAFLMQLDGRLTMLTNKVDNIIANLNSIFAFQMKVDEFMAQAKAPKTRKKKEV